MGETPKIADPLEALDAARALFESAEDFTVGVEEEFAILDPATLDMTAGFERIDEAARSGPLAGMVAGELIRSEVEVRTGRCETFPEAADAMARRRLDLLDVAERIGYSLAATGTHPFARWQDQAVIDTPHYHLVESTLRYVAWRNNTFGIHVHTGIRGADRAVAVSSALRSVLPELLAASCSSPWLEDRHTHLHSTRTQIFTKFFPRCGVPDSLADWEEYAEFVRFLISTRSIREHTEIWWTIRPHQSFGTVEIRACDALPDVNESLALCALQVALAARFARMYDEGEPLPVYEHRYLEENVWRSIRWGLDWELVDFAARRSVPAPDRVRALLELCGPEIDALGLAPYLPPLERILAEGDNASRFVRRMEAGESHRDIFTEQVALMRSSVEHDPVTR